MILRILFVLIISFLHENSNAQTWSNKELSVLKKYGLDTTEIRGIEITIKDDSKISFELVFSDYFLGENKRDFLKYELPLDERYIKYYNRPLALFDIVELYIKFHNL